ncbi:uncharacterized protein LOC131622279 [Vicia villosa]|uniref:uncharacterized protein LOC131622279 n=1 Tax=Vicia villosa TaxID=3911 RepID=UPI00273BE016|nr:uncharacterized protein LOC131622279 [Vicia villosa]
MFTREEVKAAIDQMHPLKAPGPDGLPAIFFQKFWRIVGSDVYSLVLAILNDGKDPSIINNTFITLIPKCKNPKTPKDFRPISLCNVIMKIVTKTIANRIKMILPEIVDEEQSAFIHGRLITDNALLAMECFHWMKKKTKGKKGVMALKLDMSKAYDRIEWEFIIGTLQSMGFPETLTSLIHRCISSVTYQILINGQPSRILTPERGLRQGDPLSPYLFILCSDVFSGMLKQANRNKSLHGIKVARGAPIITHLFFADDSLLFTRASENEGSEVMNLLKTYQVASGQVVNLEKSEASYSRNVREEVKLLIQNRMRVKTVARHSKYLGLPVIFGRSKKEIFRLVIERVWKKLKGWKEKFLSRTGKEILIKAVAQAIPSYIMSCYRLPSGVCDEIESLLAKFWWGAKNGERKLHWLSWDKLASSKGSGGMGFRGISNFNTSLLGKHFWRLLKVDNSLFARVFKSRYYPNCSIKEAALGYNPSYAWRSILSAKDCVCTGSSWRIGTGSKVSVWKDNWVPGFTRGLPLIPNSLVGREAVVSDLINHSTSCWNRDLIVGSFGPLIAHKILSLPLSWRTVEDELIWTCEKNGVYSVKSAYHKLQSESMSKKPSSSGSNFNQVWKRIWHHHLQPRVKSFLWRLGKNILPTRTNLQRKGISLDCVCPLCGLEPESTNHLFLQCNFSKAVHFSSPLGVRVPPDMDVLEWLKICLDSTDTLCSQMLCSLLWKIWEARNLLLFQKTAKPPEFVAMEAWDTVLEYNDANPIPKKMNPVPSVWNSKNHDKELAIIQVDAGCYEEGVVAFGCLIKSWDSKVIYGACKRETMSADPALAELLAIRWCLQVAKEIHLDKIIVQSDAMTVVDGINSNMSNAALELIAGDVRELCSFFKFSAIMYLNRLFLSDAHNLVKWGKILGARSWTVDPPVCFSVMAPVGVSF